MRHASYLVLLILMGCGSTEPERTPWSPPEQEGLPSSWTDCSDGASCVVVQLGCCDHCNGGVGVSVRSDAVTQVEAELAQECDTAQDCTAMGCGELSAECDQGTCILLQESL
jgi:hypothetical protein